MGRLVTLYHWTRKDRLASILEHGLDTRSEHPDWGLELRRGVTYCWLKPEHNTLTPDLKSPEHEFLEVTVDEDECLVTDMMYINLAQMYLHGELGKPRSEEAGDLLKQLYVAAAVPLAKYTDGMFMRPEVLVRRAIPVSAIRRRAGSLG